MKMKHLVWMAFIVLIACNNEQKSDSVDVSENKEKASAKSSTTEEASHSEYIALFNGENLDGWTIYGTEKWYVEDGLLVCESGPDAQYGYLGTNENYKNFELKLEFKQEANGNSGVFFRSNIEGTKIAGWQVEVAPPNHDTGGIYESYGRGWLVQIPDEKENILKMGEWNDMTIRVNNDEVTTWLNGKQMVQLDDQKIGEATGCIALQIHDGGGIKIRWKNIRLKALKS